MDMTTDSIRRDAATTPLRWYSWDSPVGLGLFVALLAIATAVIVLAFR
jgi:hypothetical protein